METALLALVGQAGHNAAVVAIGAGLLGVAAGGVGAFIYLRKRALISDAISHATLPGVGLAFLLMAGLGGDGRWLPGLLFGAATSAALGLWLVHRMTTRTRLTEDAGIGVVLSVFYGAGVALLTLIQGLGLGRPAGLESFLLGAAASLLRDEAILIAVAAAIAALAVFALRRPMTLVAFDPAYAAASGLRVSLIDAAALALALAVTVIGLKLAGLILIVALLIIPAVAARFWTDRVGRLIPLAAGFGGLAGYGGAAISTAADGLPTGPIIVLTAFALFALSFLFSPNRGLATTALRRMRFGRRAHRRQGLLALGRGEPIYDDRTLRLLRGEGLIRPDGVATAAGAAAAAGAARDEKRWAALRGAEPDAEALLRDDGLTPIEDALTPDQIAALDARLALGGS